MFNPKALASEDDRAKLAALIKTCMKLGGFEVQVNVVSRETLLAAQANPEAYRDLRIRVAGYSDYFVQLSPAMQAEVLGRTEFDRV